MIEIGIQPYEQKIVLAQRALAELRAYASAFLHEKDATPDAYQNLMEGLNDVRVTISTLTEHPKDEVVDPLRQIFQAQALPDKFILAAVADDFDAQVQYLYSMASQPITSILTLLRTEKAVPVPVDMVEQAAAKLGQFYQWARTNAPQNVMPTASGETYEHHL